MTETGVKNPRPQNGKFIENFGEKSSPSVFDLYQMRGRDGPKFLLESPPSIVVDYNGADPSLTPADMYNGQELLSPTLTLASDTAITPLRLPSPCSPMVGEPTEWLLSRRYSPQGPFPAPMEHIISQQLQGDENMFETDELDEDSGSVSLGECSELSELEFSFHQPEEGNVDHNYPPSDLHTVRHNTAPNDANQPAKASMLKHHLQETSSLDSSIPRGFRHRRSNDGSSKQEQISKDSISGSDSPTKIEPRRVQHDIEFGGHGAGGAQNFQ